MPGAQLVLYKNLLNESVYIGDGKRIRDLGRISRKTQLSEFRRQVKAMGRENSCESAGILHNHIPMTGVDQD